MKPGAGASVQSLRVIKAYVAGCRSCPNRRYYSGGAYECYALHPQHGRVIPPTVDQAIQQPDWCPLEKVNGTN